MRWNNKKPLSPNALTDSVALTPSRSYALTSHNVSPPLTSTTPGDAARLVGGEAYSRISTGVRTGTASKSSTMSVFRMRMQPMEPGLPISALSGLPWM